LLKIGFREQVNSCLDVLFVVVVVIVEDRV